MATLTQFLKLYKPVNNEVGWDDNMNANLDTLDGFIRQFMNVPSFVGTWTNATAYAVGQSVMEFETGNFFQCAVGHTSAATGPMANDRATHPTFWGAVTSPGNAAANAAAASASAAATSAQQASTSAATATNQFHAFTAIYYGAFVADPVADPQGGVRTVGDIYFNTTTNLLRVWNGTVWVTQPTPGGITDAPITTTTTYGRRNAAWVSVVASDGGRINAAGNGINAVKGTLVVGDATVPAGSAVGLVFADELEAFNHTINLTHDAAGVFHHIVTGTTPLRIHPVAANTIAFGIAPAGTAGGVAPLVDVMTINSVGSLTINGTATKPGGGPWVAPASDARVKNIVGPYPAGLAELIEMLPQMYTFKGNDNYVADDGGIGDPVHNDTTTQFVGLVAQDCEPYMPELVTQATRYIDGVLQTDVRVLDPNAITYALVNAVKTLNDMVVALQARVTALEP